jgi:hypothetical protein
MTTSTIHPATDDARFVQKSAKLSRWWSDRVVGPNEVMAVLKRAKISFVLVGAYGLAIWRKEGRATEDVDLVIAQKQLKKAARVLCDAFPNLEPLDTPVVIRLRDQESREVVIDLMKPTQQPYREAFKHTHTVVDGRPNVSRSDA